MLVFSHLALWEDGRNAQSDRK